MAITRFQPTTNDLWSPLWENFFGPAAGGSRMSSLLRAPAADVIETEHDIRVVAEMPGLKPENVDVSLEGNVLTLNGEKREERTEGDENDRYHLSERRYGQFSRSFVLPRDVEQDQIEARFENGVLSVTIPKSEKARRRRIEIQSGGNGSRQVEATSGGSNR